MNSSLSSSEFIRHGCVVYEVMGGRLHQPSILTQAFLIIIIVVIILTSPVAAAMNLRVMIAVKMIARLRVHKSNITLALLASTDLTVGVLVHPLYVALMRTILLDGTSSASCALQVLTRVLCSIGVCASLIHMALISGEWFLAMRRPFAHLTLVTDSSLLAASVLAWLLSIILHIPLAVNKSAFFPIKNTFVGLCIAFILFCHVAVYREIRRHEKQIAVQQVTVKARQQFEKDKKAFKATFIVVVVLMLCYFPILIFRAVLIRYRTKISSELLYIYLFLATLMAFLNSLLNPVIYSFRLREFRLAFIKLIFNSSEHCRG